MKALQPDILPERNDEKQPLQLNSKPIKTKKINGYAEVDELKAIIHELRGRKFKLDCGHRVTLGYFLGNDIVIKNGKTCEIICMDCGG